MLGEIVSIKCLIQRDGDEEYGAFYPELL